MADRYFIDEPIEGPSATLRGPEAHHLAHVLRARPGDEIVLFDGQGAEFAARVAVCGRSEVTLDVLERRPIDRELARQVTLGVALPKGDRQKWLVEKAVELGVARLVPLVTARAVARVDPGGLARLRRGVIEASKQCGRNRLMEIDEARSWSDYLAEAPADVQRWIAHPAEKTAEKGTFNFSAPPAAHPSAEEGKVECPLFLAVGPEGGFTDDEVAAAVAAGWRTVGLGTRILRVETAAIALAAWAALAAGE